MRRRQGLTLVEMSIVIVLLGLLGILLSQSTASSLTVGRLAVAEAEVQTRLANTIAVLRRELRGAGNLRRGLANQSPQALPSGDVLWYQVPVENPPGSGVVYDFNNRLMFWGAAHQDTLGGWTELRFEATATINEAGLGLGGADVNGNGTRNDVGLRVGRLVKQSYGTGAPPFNGASPAPLAGSRVILAEQLLDRDVSAGTQHIMFSVPNPGAGEIQGAAALIDPSTTIAGRQGTVVIDLAALTIVRADNETSARPVLATARTAMRPRNAE